MMTPNSRSSGIGPIEPRLTLRREVDESNEDELRRTLGRLLKERTRLVTTDPNDSQLLNEAAIELVSALAALSSSTPLRPRSC